MHDCNMISLSTGGGVTGVVPLLIDGERVVGVALDAFLRFGLEAIL